MTGCAATDNPESSPTPESSTSAQPVAEPSDYSTASPSPTPSPTPTGLQDSDEILEISDGLKKVTMTFSGSVTVMQLDGPQTRQLPEKLEYKAKQAITDSLLHKRSKLSPTEIQCTADDQAVKIPLVKTDSVYRPCEYPLFAREDPLFKAANQILEEVY